MSEKMISIPESLYNDASAAINSAQVYLAALRVISNAEVTSEEAKKLQAVAREAVLKADDDGILGQEEFKG